MQHGHAHAMDAMDGWMDAMPCDSDMVSTCDSDILGGDSDILGGIAMLNRA